MDAGFENLQLTTTNDEGNADITLSELDNIRRAAAT